MQYLAILKLKADTPRDKLGPVLKPAASKAWELLAAAILRTVPYIQGDDDPIGAAPLLEAVDRNEAEAHVKQLPLIEHALVNVEILSLAPFTGFAALFSTLTS